MEISSRDSIVHLISDKDRDAPPILKPISDQLALDVHNFAEGSRRLPPFGALRAAYELIGKIVATNNNVCRKGCSWCCRLPVDMMPIEANYIAANTLYKVSKLPSKVRPEYCPFMDEKTAECKIYDYRPLHCRTFVTYDSPDYCRDKEPHYISGGPIDGYCNKAILLLAKYMVSIDTNIPISQLIKSDIEDRVKDIREWFN